MTDPVTKAWLRNDSDRRALAAGCRFDVERAAYAVYWVERYCKLYEGEQAGEPLTLWGCHDCRDYGLPPAVDFASWDDAKETCLDRAARYAKCVAAGHHLDWQYECTMRLFGWVKRSKKWNREVRRFRQASVFVPKKNKKSPTLAAIGLYLTCGDGEPGQKCFFAAKDGKQARDIAGKHAIEMVEASPELSAECTINKNLMRITHERSRSLLEPLSSANSNNQKSKEGLNGSVLIDEVHVVDREFVGRISRAGISRSEPLQIEVSTAGDNPESYGKERFDYALKVQAGEIEDEQLFVAIYAVPQDLKDSDLGDDPLRWGRLANPAMGHTVDPEEFLTDYQRSKGSLVELGRFKMYRLNIWQASETPWLNMGEWASCKRDYGEADLLGLPCVGGLDLAKTRDTCALTLIFPGVEEGTFRQWAYFWAPRERAEQLRDKVRYLQWEQKGHLVLTDGNAADYAFIRKAILDARQKFTFRFLTFDDYYAAELIQRLMEEDRAFTHYEVSNFTQTVKNFAGPTDEYEALIRAGKLHHPGNPLLTWQAGNVKVKADVNANKRPVKPKPDSLQTIDGIVAGIMALANAKLLTEGGSVYDSRGVTMLGGGVESREPAVVESRWRASDDWDEDD